MRRKIKKTILCTLILSLFGGALPAAANPEPIDFTDVTEIDYTRFRKDPVPHLRNENGDLMCLGETVKDLDKSDMEKSFNCLSELFIEIYTYLNGESPIQDSFSSLLLFSSGAFGHSDEGATLSQKLNATTIRDMPLTQAEAGDDPSKQYRVDENGARLFLQMKWKYLEALTHPDMPLALDDAAATKVMSDSFDLMAGRVPPKVCGVQSGGAPTTYSVNIIAGSWSSGDPYSHELTSARGDLTAAHIDAYLATRSERFDPTRVNGQRFINWQNTYGVDARALVAIAVWESSLGTAGVATHGGNMFGYGAYDSNPSAANGWNDDAGVKAFADKLHSGSRPYWMSFKLMDDAANMNAAGQAVPGGVYFTSTSGTGAKRADTMARIDAIAGAGDGSMSGSGPSSIGYTSLCNGSMNARGASATANRAIAFALEQVGDAYQLGQPPNPHAATADWSASVNIWDCSGLVVASWAVALSESGADNPTAGKRSTETLYPMAKDGGVPYGEKLPGDILFWLNNAGQPKHTAIYIGDGRMVHASNPRTGVLEVPVYEKAPDRTIAPFVLRLFNPEDPGDEYGGDFFAGVVGDNGKIDAADMTSISHCTRTAANPCLLQKPAAEAYERMIAAGFPGYPNETYRSFSQQQKYYNDPRINKGGNTAAKPGTSPHGWGLAMDVGVGCESRTWARSKGGTYGWNPYAGARLGVCWGGASGWEDWHFNFGKGRPS